MILSKVRGKVEELVGREEVVVAWPMSDLLVQTAGLVCCFGCSAVEQEAQRSERLIAQLRALGVEPDLD
jgi:hypothetical protein